MNNNKLLVSQWQLDLADKSAVQIIAWAAKQFPQAIKFASSLGMEDQIITDIILRHHPEITVFTLDTGRLFKESYDLIEAMEKHYHTTITIMFPDAREVENMVQESGINLFYHSVANRKRCCGIRKVNPLRRALSGLDAWITGLRRDQADSRSSVEAVEWDDTYQMVKINPLWNWSDETIRKHIQENQIPYNRLHDQGYPSIGCACCTRAIATGESIRAGRWWWENESKKECGIHIIDGKVKRVSNP